MRGNSLITAHGGLNKEAIVYQYGPYAHGMAAAVMQAAFLSFLCPVFR